MTLPGRHLIASLLTLGLLTVIWAGCVDNLAEFEEIPVDEALVAELSDQLLAKSGNGAPSGSHYNLNLIGVPDKTAAMDDNNGHRIFIKLEGKSKIYLTEGDSFGVLDANGTDGNGARFQLPNPDPDNTGMTVYTVYARPLGKPGGTGSFATCATAPGPDGEFGTDDDEEVCAVSVVILREKGKSRFQNVSRDLLYVYADLTDNDTDDPMRYPLFDEALQDYLWSVDNNGLKLVQLRFYDESTNVN